MQLKVFFPSPHGRVSVIVLLGADGDGGELNFGGRVRVGRSRRDRRRQGPVPEKEASREWGATCTWFLICKGVHDQRLIWISNVN